MTQIITSWRGGQRRAESHSYRMKVTITFECEIDVEAGSATQAQFFVSETLSTIHLEESKEALKTELEENVTMAEEARINDCFYEVEPAKLIPPDQSLCVSPTMGEQED